MRSFNPLLALILSFAALVASGPLHSNTHSSRFAENPISSRQFHYPRALVDICAEVNLSAILGDVVGLLNLGGLFGDICLCLSALPLDLDFNANLKLSGNTPNQAQVQALVKNFVGNHGTQCTYPDHASPKCTSGNVCDFTCTDGFVKNGASCVCSSPKSICNGMCGAYPKGCSSALPRAPKMTRRSIIPSRDLLTTDQNVNLNSGGLLGDLLASLGITPSSSGVDVDIATLVNRLLSSLAVPIPTSGETLSANLEATLDICVGTGVSQTLLDTITKVVNSLLSSLLGVTANLEVNSSSPVDPNTASLDLQLCGASGDSLEAILTSILKEVADLFNGALTEVKIVTSCSAGGPVCTPATSTLSNLPPSPSSISVPVPSSSISPSPSSTFNGTNPSGLVDSLLMEVQGILANLGLGSANPTLDAVADPTIVVSVALSDTLSSVDGLVDTILALTRQVLDTLMPIEINLTVQANPDSTSPPVPSGLSEGDSVVIDLDLSAILNDILSEALDIVDQVSSGVVGVLADLLKVDVVANVNGGTGCGCSQTRRASGKT